MHGEHMEGALCVSPQPLEREEGEQRRLPRDEDLPEVGGRPFIGAVFVAEDDRAKEDNEQRGE